MTEPQWVAGKGIELVGRWRVEARSAYEFQSMLRQHCELLLTAAAVVAPVVISQPILADGAGDVWEARAQLSSNWMTRLQDPTLDGHPIDFTMPLVPGVEQLAGAPLRRTWALG